jgi:hypothetical protein
VHLCDQAGGPVTRYTTRAVIEAELHVLGAAGGLAANTTHGLDDRQRAAILNRSSYDGITREQALAFSVAREAGVSLRTTQRWVARYRDGGLRALARDDRADCGKRRAISPKLIEFVEGLAFSRPPLPISAIHREARQGCGSAGRASTQRGYRVARGPFYRARPGGSRPRGYQAVR